MLKGKSNEMAADGEQVVLSDSVSFLAELQAGYNKATSLISTKQLKALDVSPTAPFEKETVNEDFVRLAEAYFTLKTDSTTCSNELRSKLMEPNATGKFPDVEEHDKMLATLNKAAERIHKIWDLKLKVTEEKKGSEGLPRIIRLARRLKLSEKETTLLVFVLACQTKTGTIGRGRMSLLGNSTGTLELCQVCNMTISEMVEFVHQDRVHMQQGLFPDVQQSYILHSNISFDEVSVKALVGAPLTSSEFLKLEQTHLADVIAEESGNEHFRGDGQQPEGIDDTPPPPGIDQVCLTSFMLMHRNQFVTFKAPEKNCGYAL